MNAPLHVAPGLCGGDSILAPRLAAGAAEFPPFFRRARVKDHPAGAMERTIMPVFETATDSK